MTQTKTALHAKLRKLENVIDVQKILARNTNDTSNIAKYYKKNRLAYRLFNSHEGFVHMGISVTTLSMMPTFISKQNLCSSK